MSPDRRDMRRVLVIHNRYRMRGGEERSVEDLVGLLRERGHAVDLLERRSDQLAGLSGRVRGGTGILGGGLAPGEVKSAVRELGAEIVHAHNTVPLLGPRALEAGREAGAAIVLHLHNYRLFCAIGIAYRDGAPCTRCHGRWTWPGARLRCRGPTAESFTYAAGLALQQRRVLDAVDRFIVPSRGAERVLGEFGLPAGRAEIMPHFLPSSAFVEGSSADSGEYALFTGRLTEEKGADTVIEAAKRSGVPLAIAGEGPDELRLRRLAAGRGAEIRFLGRLGGADLVRARARAAFALTPSRWHEPHPYAVAESMAAGLPVLASRIGGLPELVGPGSTLPPRDVGAWADAMRDLWRTPDTRRHYGEAALARAHARFDEGRYYGRLMACYRRLLS
jgi:glycosyltransferase involved in cell wall biosynthesis